MITVTLTMSGAHTAVSEGNPSGPYTHRVWVFIAGQAVVIHIRGRHGEEM